MGIARGAASAARQRDEKGGPSLLARLDKLCVHLADLVEARPNRLTSPELLQRSARVLARGFGLEVWEPSSLAGWGCALLPVGQANTVLALVELELVEGAARAHLYICRDLVVAAREGA